MSINIKRVYPPTIRPSLLFVEKTFLNYKVVIWLLAGLETQNLWFIVFNNFSPSMQSRRKLYSTLRSSNNIAWKLKTHKKTWISSFQPMSTRRGVFRNQAGGGNWDMGRGGGKNEMSEIQITEMSKLYIARKNRIKESGINCTFI